MNKVIDILLLEDSEDDAGLIAMSLKRENIFFKLKRVETRNEFIESIATMPPDIILSDHALPRFNSIEAFKLYQEKKLAIPFILVTGTVSEEFAVNVLKQGMDDYILKSNLSRLPSAILNALSKRQAEQEKLKAYNELKLHHDELVKVNRELDNFVYSVSHNLRAPLRSVLGLINLTHAETKEGVVNANYLPLMERSILQLDATLNDILLYSQNNHNKIKIEQINLKELVNGVFDHFLHVTDFHKIKKEIEIEEEETLFTDSYRLSIVLRNLISNSINYRDSNKIQSIVYVSVKVNSNELTASVEDNGLGIEEEYIPRIFDMFFRANEKSEGAGLGLYITREIINRLNGKLSIESKLKVGTKAAFTIPNYLITRTDKNAVDN